MDIKKQGVVACIVLFVFPGFLSVPDSARNSFNKLKFNLCKNVAKRHFDYGSDLEDRKIHTQAMEQFKIAMEHGTGKCQPKAQKAYHVLNNYIQRGIGRYYHYPNKTERIHYRRKAGSYRKVDRKEVWKKLADFAAKNATELFEEADSLYKELVYETNDLLKIDKKGLVILPNGEGPIHKNFSARFIKSEGVIQVNKKPFLRDAFFKSNPDIKEVIMKEGKNFRVFCQKEIGMLDEIFNLWKALYPKLKVEWDDEPDRVLSLFVFSDLEAYKAYCMAINSAPLANVRSFSNNSHFYSVICLENPLDSLTVNQASQVLLQMAVLFAFGINGMEMPDWFTLGQAERFGGKGAFEWVKGRYKLKRGLDKQRLLSLVNNGCFFPLEDFFNLSVSNVPLNRLDDYYTQCWAMVTFLKQGGCARMLELWEENCYRQRFDLKKTREEFLKRFINSLPTLDDKFLEFLKKS